MAAASLYLAARTPFSATTWPPKEIFSLSRSAASPALAHRHHDAAPIGVVAGDGRLDQRRIGDRKRDALGRLVALRASDIDADQLLRALAVPHHLQRQIEQHRVQRCGGIR